MVGLGAQCPLLAQGRHAQCADECPLLGAKRTRTNRWADQAGRVLQEAAIKALTVLARVESEIAAPPPRTGNHQLDRRRVPRESRGRFRRSALPRRPARVRTFLPLRDSLTSAEANEAVLCYGGFIHAATTEFQIDWLEGMQGNARDLFGVVVSGLMLSRKGMKAPLVMTGERPFPANSVAPEQHRRMARFVPIEEFTERVAPRLRELARTEPPPKVMPDVLEAWAIRD